MYASGTGTAQNDVSALKWAFLSKCNYETDRYDKDLREIAGRLDRDQIAAAERMALDWIDGAGAAAPNFPGFLRNPIQDYLNSVE